MDTPIAVCISDIHFSIKNLEPATYALKHAINKAKDLSVPLIIAGDLIDTKAILHGEVTNRLVQILSAKKVRTYVIVGNHDMLNEKGEENNLNFLVPYVTLVDFPCHILADNLYLVPYQNSTNVVFLAQLKSIPKGSTLIMHQGFKGAFMGDYIQDKTSMDPVLLKDYKVISGHYHKHQTIGTVTYIGSPYTITFGEANDGEKGYLILNKDGSYTREILNLRAHTIIELYLDSNGEIIGDLPNLSNKDTILWCKIWGPRSSLKLVNKEKLGIKLLGHSNFKLDLITIDNNEKENLHFEQMREDIILDSLIDSSNETLQQKEFLKNLYRSILS